MSIQTPTSKGALFAFKRRTLYVWAALLGSMTLVSALLLMMESGHGAPAAGSLDLRASDNYQAQLEKSLDTAVPIIDRRWAGIVIHHSGQQSGNAASLSQLHDKLGYNGLSYHFVIGNGSQSPDGAIETAERWRRQIDGVYGERVISICIVGNGDHAAFTEKQLQSLELLTGMLSDRLNIPVNNVVAHRETYLTSSPGMHFDIEAFRITLQSRPVTYR